MFECYEMMINLKIYFFYTDGNVEKSYMLKIPQEVNLHFMDIPSYSLKKEVPADVSFGCLYQSWTYIALLANQVWENRIHLDYQ